MNLDLEQFRQEVGAEAAKITAPEEPLLQAGGAMLPWVAEILETAQARKQLEDLVIPWWGGGIIKVINQGLAVIYTHQRPTDAWESLSHHPSGISYTEKAIIPKDHYSVLRVRVLEHRLSINEKGYRCIRVDRDDGALPIAQSEVRYCHNDWVELIKRISKGFTKPEDLSDNRCFQAMGDTARHLQDKFVSVCAQDLVTGALPAQIDQIFAEQITTYKQAGVFYESLEAFKQALLAKTIKPKKKFFLFSGS